MTKSRRDRMRRGSSRIWEGFLLLAALALLVVVFLRPHARDGQSSNVVGRPLPQLELEPLTGDSRPLRAADLRGQVVLLNFWGTWCGPCRMEFPHLVALGEKLTGREGFRMILVSCEGGNESFEDLRAATHEFMSQHDASLPTYADPGAVTRRGILMVSGEEGYSYPTTLVLDGQGLIRGYWNGYDPSYIEAMDQLIEQLLVSAPEPSKPGPSK